MSLVHYIQPFLELGICKEFVMARKSNGSSTTTRSKKSSLATQPVPAQVAPEPITSESFAKPEAIGKPEVKEIAIKKDVPISGKSLTLVQSNPVSSSNSNINIEEEIRRRAYELYLERCAVSGYESGDESQDWLRAEREVRTRFGPRGLAQAAGK
jgi:hypothetical protein